MAEKKISFSLKPIIKTKIVQPEKKEKRTESGIELIQCIENRSILLVEDKCETTLVIPLKNNQKTASAFATLQNLRDVLKNEPDKTHLQYNKTSAKNECGPSRTSTIDQRVITELISEASELDKDSVVSDNILKLPIVAKQTINGATESKADDYNQVPIEQFGAALLRGMGLTDNQIISKDAKDPEIRPKGMGLGADKVLKKTGLLVEPRANEVLAIKKNAFAKLLAGQYKDCYGQIQGMDDQSCRVIVKLAIGGRAVMVNEFMVQPVTQKEYLEYGKTINSTKYGEYSQKRPTHRSQQASGKVSSRDSPKNNLPGTSSRRNDEDVNTYGRDVSTKDPTGRKVERFSRGRSHDRYRSDNRKGRPLHQTDRKHHECGRKQRHQRSSSVSSSECDSRNSRQNHKAAKDWKITK